MKHPNLEFVQKFIPTLFEKRKYADWHLETVTFSPFPSAYELVFVNKETNATIPVKLVTELIDDVEDGHDPFKQRKIKDMIKTALGIKHDV